MRSSGLFYFPRLAIASWLLILTGGANLMAGESSTATLPLSLQHWVYLAEPGQTISTGDFDLTALKSLPAIPIEKKPGGPPLVVSDDPEYIRVREGLALREEIGPGIARIYIYNVNGIREAPTERRLTAVLENLDTSDTLRFRFLRRAFPAPGPNYHKIGKAGLVGFLTSAPETEWHEIPPAGAAPLDERMENAIVRGDDLVHGFYEIELTERARLSVLQTSPETPGPLAARRLQTILASPRKNAGRGVFHPSDYAVRAAPGFTLDTAGGPRQLLLADGETDPWIGGQESSTTGPVVLRGNYGVMYRVEIPRASGDGRALALVTWNHRWKDQWCGGMAAVVEVSEGAHPAGVVEIPSDQLNTTGPPELVVIQVFPPLPPGQSDVIRLTFSPPGASCLPVPLVFLPIEAP